EVTTMPNAWEGDNLIDNLKVLGSLEEGDNIFLWPNGKYTLQEGNPKGVQRLVQPLVRTVTGVGITNDKSYLTPLTRIFEEALRALYSRRKFPQLPGRRLEEEDINQALKGLGKLEETYYERYKESDQDKCTKFKEIKDRVWQARKDIKPGVLLKDDFADECVIPLWQNGWLPPDNEGVCQAVCIDWFCRILMKDKESYRTRK